MAAVRWLRTPCSKGYNPVKSEVCTGLVAEDTEKQRSLKEKDRLSASKRGVQIR